MSVSHGTNVDTIYAAWTIFSEGSKGLNFAGNCTQLKFKPGTVEKNEPTIVSPAGIEPTLLRLKKGEGNSIMIL